MSAAIETEGLTDQYGKNWGIRRVDLVVEEGEVFGFLGPNGAGKTTTIRTLLGFLRPSGGRAWVFGMDIRKKGVEIRARAGNLPGESALEDRMSGEELLRFFARLRGVKDLGYAHDSPTGWRRIWGVRCGVSVGETSRRSGSYRPCSTGRRF
jgi:ABC-2 type transport system ATP-binding protein